ncbi:MAG: glycosyltransferase [Anaerolineales bacterium]|nr:glycosyltransferase [Anaerolineales bacterium]
MRVGMLSYHTCPLALLGGKDTGGMNVYVRDLTRELGIHGIGVDVFTRSQDEHVPHVLHDLGYGNRVVHIPAGPEVPMPREALAEYLPDFVRGIREFQRIKNFRYDLIHSHYWLSGIAALQLREEIGAPIIQMFHTLGITKSKIARAEHEHPSQLRLDTERRLLTQADCVVSSTNAEVEEIHQYFGNNVTEIEVIPPGVDLSHFYPIDKDEAREFVGAPCAQKMILFVGRIEPLKGVDALIEAVALLNQEGIFDKERFCLAIIGGDPQASEKEMTAEMNRLLTLRDQHHLQELVIFLGKRSQDSLPYYYSAARVVVVPSHYESFGLVALEAMACGTPVIATDTGGLAYLIKDAETGFHVPVGDPAILAERIKCLLLNEELRTHMAKAAHEYARTYAWSSVVNRIITLYEKVLREKKGIQPETTSKVRA